MNEISSVVELPSGLDGHWCGQFRPTPAQAEVASSLDTLKQALAIVVSGVALIGAAFLGAAHLKMHGHYHCLPGPGPTVGLCALRYSYWTVGRAWWQIPAAIVIAAVGFGSAVALLRKPRLRSRQGIPEGRPPSGSSTSRPGR